MNDNELEHWAEQQEEARSVRGGMVVVAYVTIAALAGAALMAVGLAVMLGRLL